MTKIRAGLGGLLAATIVVAGCTDPMIFDAETDPNARAKETAIAGAVLGGLAGAIADDGGAKGLILGAAGGAAVGAAAGSFLDRQAADLRRDFESDRIDVVNTGEELVVTMPQDILFDVDSARLSPDLRADLRTLGDSLNEYPDSNVLVFGHTDDTGSFDHNLELSQRRAGSVTRVLENRSVDPARLRTIGRGEDQPIASNDTDFGRAQNRRVEIVIRPYDTL